MSEVMRRAEKGICFTCGKKDSYKSMDAGHYIHGNRMDFVPMNIHCQCSRCNRFLHGNLGVYGERLIAEYGEQAVAELRELSKKEHKFTIIELEDIINELKSKLKTLQEMSK